MVKKRFVMAIGAGKEQVYSIKTAASLGLKVAAVDGNPEAEGFKFSQASYNIDTKNENAVLEIARRHNIEAVIPACIGRYITTTGYINDKLNLIGPGYYAASHCADKKAFHSLLKSAGLPAAELRYGKEDILRGGLSYPVIVKPRYGSGSKGVMRIESREEMEEYLAGYKLTASMGDLMAERYIEGTEYSVDLIAACGKIVFFNLRDKSVTPLPYRQEIEYTSPSSAGSEIYGAVRNIMLKIMPLLKITDTMMHADVIYTKDGRPFIIDISPRPAGLNIITKMLKYNTGRDLISEWIKYQVWKEPIKPVKINNTVCMQYLPFEDMTVKSVPDAIRLKEKYGAKEIEINLKKGARLGRIQNGDDLAERGYFIIDGGDYKETRKKNIIDGIREEISNG